MRSLISIALALSTATLVSAAPTMSVDLSPLNFPADNLSAMLDSNIISMAHGCPSADNSCGIVTFKNGQYTSFGQGTCMQLGGNVASIYVAKCFCSLWNSCTGNSGKDTYVGGMMMCEKPKKVEDFNKEVTYISCGGMN
ncbi:hypothetical protein BU25DRAFT_421030 [Macroventuria anomochaeta]|uniref:Uncharacterized protein n=1 Tax=Macroventuria anomochaeta TaxID=301207 RepID=A0ACB6S2T7_9PLEO|nr:uncharacterized protein BU25DRAFT_421030 [Macroventuria anomochaeta]KAF2628581.1 hypothetical protein BU25DRAFT_421030 [Macroventuria anomochaeta]